MSNLGSLISSCHLQVAFTYIFLVHKTAWFSYSCFGMNVFSRSNAISHTPVMVKTNNQLKWRWTLWFLRYRKIEKYFISNEYYFHRFVSSLRFLILMGIGWLTYSRWKCDKMENFHVLCCKKHKELYPSWIYLWRRLWRTAFSYIPTGRKGLKLADTRGQHKWSLSESHSFCLLLPGIIWALTWLHFRNTDETNKQTKTHTTNKQTKPQQQSWVQG